MNFWDISNACFEATGSVVIWLNFRRLLRDRSVRGVDWRVTLFYAAWGVWNLPYYHAVGSYWSAIAASGIMLGNTSWVVLALQIMGRERLLAGTPGASKLSK